MKLLDLILGAKPEGELQFQHDPSLDGAVGINATLEACLATATLATVFEDAASDGLTIADALELAKPVTRLARALRDYPTLGAELADLTPHETEVVISEVLGVTDKLDNPGVRVMVTKALAILPGLTDLFQTAREVRAGTYAPPAEDVV